MTERWKPLPHNRYAVSSYGRVKRLTSGASTSAGRLLRSHANKVTGRLQVGWYPVVGKRERSYVATLVAQAFIGPRPADHDINHKDGNCTNNHVENLEYVTRSENVKHAYAIGLIRPLQGTLQTNAKLTDEAVRFIRDSPESGVALAKRFGVKQSTISGARNRQSWKHLP